MPLRTRTRKVVGRSPARSASTRPTTRPTPSTSPPATRCSPPRPAAAASPRRDGATATGRSSDGTVFIDDQDVGLGETISHRRRVERHADRAADARAADRRQAGGRAQAAALGAGRRRRSLVVVVAVLAVLGSSLFVDQDVDVEGAVYTDQAALQRGRRRAEGHAGAARRHRRGRARAGGDPVGRGGAGDDADFPSSATIELRERTPGGHLPGPRRAVPRPRQQGSGARRARRPARRLPAARQRRRPEPRGRASSPRRASSPPPAWPGRSRPRCGRVAESATVTPDGSDLRLQLQGDIEVRFGPAATSSPSWCGCRPSSPSSTTGRVVRRRLHERGDGRVTRRPPGGRECTPLSP